LLSLDKNCGYTTLIDVTCGEFPMTRHAVPSPNVSLSCYPVACLLKKCPKHYVTGTHAVTHPTRHILPDFVNPTVKHRSCLHFVLADKVARLEDSEALGLRLGLHGSTSIMMKYNLFVIKKNKSCTPWAGNIDIGITRVTVLDLAAELTSKWDTSRRRTLRSQKAGLRISKSRKVLCNCLPFPAWGGNRNGKTTSRCGKGEGGSR
jgi:hypothetical protein